MALNDTFERQDDDTEMGWGYDDSTNNPTGEKGGEAERIPSDTGTDTDLGYEEEDYEDDIV